MDYQVELQRINELENELNDATPAEMKEIGTEALESAKSVIQSTMIGMELAQAIMEWAEWENDKISNAKTRKEVGKALWHRVSDHVHALTGCQVATIEIR